MAEKKEWTGITLNELTALGKVVDDPQFVDMGGGNECAFLNLRVYTGELGTNGQWTDNAIVLPLLAMDQGKVKTVKNHVQKGRELYIKGYYKSWTDAQQTAQHGFVITMMKLGSKPYVKPEDAEGRVGMSVPT